MNLSKQKETILLIMWTQSLIALLGSLMYSEIMGYVPCELCWIQRIFMYPLVIIFGVALIKRNISIAIPGVILSGLGILVSIYHYGLQKAPFMRNAGEFCGEVPCNLQYVNYFGFITIPFLAGTAFLVILVMSLFLYKR